MIGDAGDYRIEPLDRKHDRAAFSCGVEALDRYLHTQASQDLRRRIASVFVLVPVASATVAGYYTLSAAALALPELPEDVTRRLPRYPMLPATLIGRLAIDQRCRGQGLGGRLLFDAFDRSLRSEIASLMIIVDAKDEAAALFYEHYEFRRLPNQEGRLFLLLETIARLRAT